MFGGDEDGGVEREAGERGVEEERGRRKGASNLVSIERVIKHLRRED
jgi:hypothetical protein